MCYFGHAKVGGNRTRSVSRVDPGLKDAVRDSDSVIQCEIRDGCRGTKEVAENIVPDPI